MCLVNIVSREISILESIELVKKNLNSIDDKW